MNPSDISNLTPDVMTFVILIIVGRVLKAIPSLKDWVIPVILLLLGSGLYLVLATPWNLRNIAEGFIIAATAIGLYGTAKQAVVSRVEDAGKDPHNAVTNLVFGTMPKPQPTTTDPKTQ